MATTQHPDFPLAESVFADAAARFKDGLPESQKKHFQIVGSPSDVLDSIKRHIEGLETRQRGRLFSACESIDKFGQALQPYFQIINIFVSSHPEWAGIVWGALQLVFQLSSQFVEFFERLSQMLQEINNALPIYNYQLELIKERAEEVGWRSSYEVLLRSLSYVYVDIIEFCHDSCQLFSKKRKGFRYKIGMISGQFWVPFDDRFSKVLGRLRTHKELFESGLRVVYSEEMLKHFRAMELEMEKNAQIQQDWENQREIKEQKTMKKRLLELQMWIGAPNFMGPFESAGRQRTKDSGKWLLQNPIYCNWISQQIHPSNIAGNFATNLLVVSGKPGYGKTILATYMIEELIRQSSQARNLSLPESAESTGESTCVSFFYFDQQQLIMSSPIAALRSIAMQLLYARHHDKSFLDMASIQMNEQGRGQINASENVLCSLIRLFLEQLGASYIIIDGLDECSDWEGFFRSLLECAEHADSKIALFTRPHILLSSVMQEESFHLELIGQENSEDIRLFLRPQVEKLLADTKIGGNLSGEEIVAKLSQHADSIFLWATLIIKFLHQPALTPRERFDIIQGEVSFVGLENLYTRILEDIQKRIPKAQHIKIIRIFRWLVTIQELWSDKVLEMALAVQENRKCTKDDFVKNFKKSLVGLCGSLVEIREDRTVRFIHLSVAEYLTKILDPAAQRAFYVQYNVAHCSLAKLCLNYLIHEVPGEPLSRSPSLNVNRDIVSKAYPLLPYVARHWPLHACQSLRVLAELEEAEVGEIFKQKCFATLIETLFKAIETKSLVTAWIKAAWIYNSSPLILDLSSKVAEHTGFCSLRSRTKILSFSKTLSRLASGLVHLKDDWHHVLSLQPIEIWQPSINAFSKPEFWMGTTEAQITSLFSKNEENGSVMIASQVSADGKEVGIIKAWPPRHSEGGNHAEVPGIGPSEEDARGSHFEEFWQVTYQIWSLDTKEQVMSFYFKVPPELILKDRICAGGGVKSTGFRFPVAFSSSLRLAIILGMAIQISEAEERGVTLHCNAQELVPIGCQNSEAYDALLNDIHIPLYTSRFSSSSKNLGSHYNHTAQHPYCHDWSRYYLHPSERYLAILNGSGPPHVNLKSYPTYVLDIYENHGSPKAALFRPIGSVGLQSCSKAAQFLCFHPKKAVLAIALLSITVIWQFTERGSMLSKVYDKPLNNLGFSNCGNWLTGTRLGGDSPNLPPVRVLFPLALKVTPMIQSSTEPGLAKDFSQQLVPGDQTQGGGVIQRATSYIQNSGLPEFSATQGQMQISVLTQDNNVGAIVRQTMNANGTLTDETITRIPKRSTLEQSYSTLVPTKVSDDVRLVLNKAVQESYPPNNPSDFQLPAVIDRKTSSIPRYVSTVSQGQVVLSGLPVQKRIGSGSKSRYERENSIVKRPRVN